MDYRKPPRAPRIVEPAAAEPVDDAEDGDPAGAADAAGERREHDVGAAEHGQRVDRLLVTMAPEFSRTHLQSLVARGLVAVDGAPVRQASRRVRAGQRIAVGLVPTEESLAFRPQAMPITVLYEDDALLVLDKPAGLVVHPAAGNWSGTLLNGLLARHPGAERLPRAGIVHRLDKDTSGVMVVGKSLPAVTALARAIAERRVQRRYLAIAHGELREPALRIDAPIGRDPVSRVRMAVVAGGKPARTDVARVAARDGCSALACTLHTGRTHQIRVHLASRGHPLVADALYGGRPALGMTRQALHALRLELPHPDDGRVLGIDCAPPADFARAWESVAGQAAAWPGAADDGRRSPRAASSTTTMRH
ncbi:MAG TPA: RluA family pseudouridine synthase [Rubrivivax sp.]|nr:RluA family pseudouridine synthase [Rubrivivax sp.]